MQDISSYDFKPFCRAFYDKDEQQVICYEHSESGRRRLTGTDRMNKEECKDCRQLTREIDRMLKHKKEMNGRWM